MNNVLAPINIHLHNFICELEPSLSREVQIFFFLLLGLQDDGNIQFHLDAEKFYAKWEAKWNALLELYDTDVIEFEAGTFHQAEEFRPIIQKAIQEILANRFETIIEWREQNVVSPEESTTKLFVACLCNDQLNLYITRYFDSKCIIEDKVRRIFLGGTKPDFAQIQECITKIASIHKKDLKFARAKNPEGRFLVNEEQAEAILRGQNENLIITGGPGTGKTTVVLYILWCLLENHPEYMDYDIRLAAPSGKAADRMRESLIGGLADIEADARATNPDIFEKLSGLESSTLHRLLMYSPNDGSFRYNQKHQFNEKSIFVVDEASMIDISLFAAFLQAVPEGARVFVLGDPYQLPSVEAGAVLGEILHPKNSKRNFIVKLVISNRFTDDSEIGALAKSVQKLMIPPMVEGQCVKFVESGFQTRKAEEENIIHLVSEWVEDLIEISAMAKNILSNETAQQRIWSAMLKKRILTAERRGVRGVEELNRIACRKILKSSKGHVESDGTYFAGEPLILTRNQSLYKLYNGDMGIVVFQEGRPYLMLKKDSFVFYPLSVLPADALEPAFAITIHKSQGSEYDNVLMFLPTKIGHPLLTNQILYTGITRAKKMVSIVATAEAFAAACTTVTERDTGIEL